ncbi:hypothetical protein [Phenylobacterium sp.]|uniref:hypothetical protein n=1 Tax=Phenylobacterium sp. TaxID=1871053 RepID=UPI00260D3994|nr:hypothetical protein [Phenylobacterium sp.]
MSLSEKDRALVEQAAADALGWEPSVAESAGRGESGFVMQEAWKDACKAAMLGFQAARSEGQGEPVAVEECVACQGNGEIVTDWSRYLGPAQPGDQGDEGTSPCPDCDGVGSVPLAPPPPANDRTKALEEALRFYADQWIGEPYGDEEGGQAVGIEGRPTPKLLADEGRIARAALTPSDQAEKGDDHGG